MRRYCFILCGLICLLSCKKENNPCLKSRGDTKVETRSLPQGIRILTLEDNVNLFVIQDSIEYIHIEAGENLLDFIRTDVEGTALTIKNDNKCNFLRTFKKKINAYLHIADLDSVELNGSGSLTIADTFYTKQIVFNMSRTTGDLDLLLNCEERSRFNLHNGASKVKVRGVSRYNIAYNSGSGWFYFDEMNAHFFQANSKSSGNIYIGKPNILFVLLNGSGDIVYKGVEEAVEIWEHGGDGQLIKTGI
jgi:hypothetical protein